MSIFVAYYSIMYPGSVSSFPPTAARYLTHDGIVSVRIIIIQENNFWGVRRGAQSTNRVSRSNINGSCKSIIVIERLFFQVATIINGNGGGGVQNWSNTINWKGIIESFINYHFLITSFKLSCM